MKGEFAADGIMNVAAFERGREFDASYFRETRPAWQEASDIVCHGAWLREPDDSAPASAREHLQRLRLDLWCYPSAFPWQYYAQRRPTVGASRWTALDDFIESGFEHGNDLPFSEDALGFLVAVADCYAGRKDHLTLKAFGLAKCLGALTLEQTQHMADAHLRLQHWASAQLWYRSILFDPNAHVWTVHNLVVVSKRLQDWDAAFEALTSSMRRLGHESRWQTTARDTIDAYFTWCLDAARASYAAQQRPRGDAMVAGAVSRAAALIEQLEPPLAQTTGRRDRVLLVENGGDAESRAYRLDYKERLLAGAGRPWTRIGADDVIDAELDDAAVAIFFEVPASPNAIRGLLALRARGVATIFEAHTPVYDIERAPAPLRSFAGYLHPVLHDQLTLDVALRRGFAALCDHGLVATRDQALRVAGLVRRCSAEVLEDGLQDERHADIIIDSADEGSAGLGPLFLRSVGFIALAPETSEAARALLDTLRATNELRLVVCGPVHVSKDFDVIDDRVSEIADPSAGGDVLRRACANVIVEPVEGNTGAVGVRWLEAALHGVPSIMQAEYAAALGLTDGKDCLSVHRPADWRRLLASLVADPSLGRRIGRRAEEKVLRERNEQVLGARFDDIINALLGTPR